MKSERSSPVRGSDLPKCHSAHTSVGDMWRGPGRTRWQGRDRPGRQAHMLEETLRVHNTKQDEKNAVFRRNDTWSCRNRHIPTIPGTRYVPVDNTWYLVDNMTTSHTFPELWPFHRIMHNRRMVWTFSTQQCHILCMIRRTRTDFFFNPCFSHTRACTRMVSGIILVLQKSWKTSAVSTTVGMVETQLCTLRGTSDTFV